MPMQTAERVQAIIKRETSLGVKPTAASGHVLRLIDSPGLKLTRAPIPTEERSASQLEGMQRLGGKNVGGSYNMEIVPGGAFDLLCEAGLRGTLGPLDVYTDFSTTTQLKRVQTPETPVAYSHCIEQVDLDADGSEVFLGVRVTGLDFSLQPRARAKLQVTMQGLDRELLSGASSPYYSTPSTTVGDSLIVDDAAIYYDGALMTKLTGLDISVPVAAATQDVIGSFVSPDVFLNMLRITGTVSCIREDMAALADFDSEAEFAIRAIMRAPGAGHVLTFGINLPRVKIADIDAPFLGGQAAKVEARQFTAHYPLGAFNAIEFYTSTNTPVAVT